PYKGPVLAMLAYGNLAGREYADLDFALPQRYIPEAIAALQTAGFRSLFDRGEAHAGENGFAPGQYTFLSAKPAEMLVELHTERTLRYYPTPVDFHDLMSRLIRVEIAGQSLCTFSVEDTLVMLSVHGAKHFWERLFWILDIARLIGVRPVDWPLLYDVAARMECTRLLLLGLSLAHDLFGAPLPDSVLQDVRGDKQVRLLAEDVLGRFAGIPGPGSGVWPRTVFRVRSRDKFLQGLSHTMRLGMSPTESDRQNVRLPRFLAPLYMLLRPWRLFREYGLGSKPRPERARK
ncbi:MAG: nucleotidyltransferase family protein, partial [Candidatus Acidiferrales bacterium]